MHRSAPYVKHPCSFIFVANVLILEPWHRGSHHNWFTGWASTSRHNLNVAEATELGWRKSLITAPTQFAAKIQDCHGEIDALVACTPIDLPAVFGLLDRSLKRPPDTSIHARKSNRLSARTQRGPVFSRHRCRLGINHGSRSNSGGNKLSRQPIEISNATICSGPHSRCR